ncbi:putative ABC transport system permease protein [Mesorhizobium albiziae]|uniref:Putative ABC transport system permease protein n=1 Tax=Neomesorhizobium albiziae TaxID=335020 RepID=A0A1I3VBE2_9HYPH|nr:FtsX-like permease family protein [Mesorhizobium albiziae]GLS28806.1 membrane protein [Mesorhizobium albiziae]SFJ92784.1 putative ABC transport system permease protein [Mesorhizobium albiziae]
MNPLPLVAAMLARNRLTSLLFVALIALAVGLGIAISAQERALRQGSARAADRFDLVVAAPGSLTDVLFSVVYLRPSAVELLPPTVFTKLLGEPKAEFVAPVGFGDSLDGDPVVGTTATFAQHLSGGSLAEGRVFERFDEAVLGALSSHKVGDDLQVSHGHGEASPEADAGGLHGQKLHVVGRLKPTGTPWDRAVVTPIEFNWYVHGLGTGHAEGDAHIGPPFAADKLPGVPAVIVKPGTVPAAYGLRNAYRTTGSTAFFPAEVLVELYALMGDVGRIMGALTLATQVLVVAAILAGMLALLDLQRQRFAVLRALGASRLFIFLTVWSYVTLLIAAGALGGLLLGWGVAGIISHFLTQASGVAMRATVGGAEFRLVGALLFVGALLAAVPAILIYRRPVIDALRQ